VHHVIAFIIPPKRSPPYEPSTPPTPTPATCATAAPAARRPGWLGAWVPGSSGGALPEGTGMRVEPGSKIVVQMHYHTLPGAGPDPLDAGAAHRRHRRAPEAYVLPFTNPGLDHSDQPDDDPRR
jgi:hypothetical protein